MKQHKQSNQEFKARALNSTEKVVSVLLDVPMDLVYQTATPQGVVTTLEVTSTDALRDDISSPGLCKIEDSSTLAKEERLETTCERQLSQAQRTSNIVEENIAPKDASPSGELTRKGSQGRVLVVGQDRKPCMPCNPARARKLLKAGKAKILRYFPFVIQLNYSPTGVQEVDIKVDQGTRTTGISLNILTQRGWRTVWAMHLIHHPDEIKASLLKRKAQRRGRRSRNTRYRQPRFNNRKRKEGWFAPSLMTNVINIRTWVKRLTKYTPVTKITVEDVKFDTQLLEDPTISGKQYQYGTLYRTELREHTLWKYNYTCSYCGIKNIPLTDDHIVPRVPRLPGRKPGSDRPENQTAACRPCNEKKSNYTVEEFAELLGLKGGAKAFPLLNNQTREEKNLQAAGFINSLRFKIIKEIEKETKIKVDLGSGGKTKFNREKQQYPKIHWVDASCIGINGEKVFLNPNMQVYEVWACSRNARRMRQPDSFGFPKGKTKESSSFHGIRTGDIGKAVVTKGKNKGTWIGRIAIRNTGTFKVGKKDGINYKKIKIIQKKDGYSYNFIYPQQFQNKTLK